MNVRRVDQRIDPQLSAALTAFERGFTYPLGEYQRFSTDHGADYTRFFRAMGPSQCFVAEREGAIAGVLSTATRRVIQPDGTQREACYLGDLKIAPGARGGRVLLQLARSARSWVPGTIDAAYAVMMDGIQPTPDRYTGRAGVPSLHPSARVVVARLDTSAERSSDPGYVIEPDTERASQCLLDLSRGRYWAASGDPAERSSIAPVWLMHHGGGAVGRLEDTRLAKRLVLDEGAELAAAHLSCFAYNDAQRGTALVQAALDRAAALGFAWMFVSMPPSDAAQVLRRFDRPGVTFANATVYAHGFVGGVEWNINTAEI